MNSIKFILCAVPIGVFLVSGTAFAHPGGLDSKGGHYNRKTGEYHYHRGSGAAVTKASIKTETKRDAKKSAPKTSTSKKRSKK